MPHRQRTLSLHVLRGLSLESFWTSGRDRFGIEAEWPTHAHGDIEARPGQPRMNDLSRLTPPRGGRITFEPGGQLELSTAPADSVGGALEAFAEDARFAHAALAGAGFSCSDLAVDGRRPPRRVAERGRYAAMESFFAAGGTSGAWMMNNTASTQVNLSHDEADPVRRWYTLNQIGPLLIAAFANSPGVDQRGVHWASLREAIWWSVDPGRTRPVRLDIAPGTAWLEYALDADVAFVCRDGSDGLHGVGLGPGLPFGRWVRDGHELGWPTADDFRYHLSMLFPPVRPRGWLEVRVIDALPDWLRTVAFLVVATAGTAAAGRELATEIPPTGHLWLTASRVGVRAPRIAAAADTMLDVVRRHLGLVTQDPAHEVLVAEFVDRYLARRRMPGDDGASEADLRIAERAAVFA